MLPALTAAPLSAVGITLHGERTRVARTQDYQDWLDGKPGAEQRLYKQTWNLALRVAATYLHGSSVDGFDAEDVASHAVSALFNAPPASSDLAFVFVVAKNRARSLIGRGKKKIDSLGSVDEGGVDPEAPRAIDELLLQRLRKLQERLQDSIRCYISDGSEPKDEARRARIALWLFALADPDTAGLQSLEMFTAIQRRTSASESALWRDRRVAKSVAWLWVRQHAERVLSAADKNELFEKYCERVEQALRGQESGDEDE